MTEENQNQGQQNDQQGQSQGQGQQQQQQQQQGDQRQDEGQQKEVKFTQDDLNKFAAKVRAEEKAKAEKELNDFKAQIEKETERAKMTEQERIKAEKEDAEKKLQDLQNQIDYNNKKSEALKGLAEAKLDSRLIDVLMSDKSNEDKIKIIADVHKEAIEKAIKDAMPAHKPSGLTTSTSSGDKKLKYSFEKFK